MKEYDVVIKETLSMTVTVEADSAAQAKEIAERNYNNSDYILDASHYKGVVFSVPPKNRDMER